MSVSSTGPMSLPRSRIVSFMSLRLNLWYLMPDAW